MELVRTIPRMGQNLGLVKKQKINRSKKCGKAKKLPRFPRKSRGLWLRGPDLNRRPSGYEPDELPDCSTPRYNFGAGDRGRTGTGFLPRDFKSRASANSATPAYWHLSIIAQAKPAVNPLFQEQKYILFPGLFICPVSLAHL